MEGGKGNVRKRGSSSSSSSSSLMAKNYRLKRTFLMGKRRGLTTPVPTWKMISSRSQSMENDGKAFSYLHGDNGNGLSVSVRQLAALLWEIDAMPSPTLKMQFLEDKKIQVGMAGNDSKLRSMELALFDPFLTTVSEGLLDPTKLCRCRRRALAGSQKLRNSTAIPSCSGLVDETQINGQKSNLKDVYNGLTASKQLLEVLIRVWGVEQLDCTSTTLVSALRVELDRSCDRVRKLIRGEKTEKSGIKHSIHNAVPSIVGELETEKKLNKKAGAELAETMAALAMAIREVESEKKARKKVEQVCEELARGVWELKRQFAKVREEVEKEREMFHLADLLREERVQMKLSEAKCVYEEQNAVVEKLRNELEAYLKGHKKRVFGETIHGSVENQDKECEDEEEESDDSDLESIELSMEEMSKTFFLWGDAVKNRSKRNSVDISKERKCITEECGKAMISSKMQ